MPPPSEGELATVYVLRADGYAKHANSSEGYGVETLTDSSSVSQRM